MLNIKIDAKNKDYLCSWDAVEEDIFVLGVVLWQTIAQLALSYNDDKYAALALYDKIIQDIKMSWSNIMREWGAIKDWITRLWDLL